MLRASKLRSLVALACALQLAIAPAIAQSPAPQQPPAIAPSTTPDAKKAKKAFENGRRAEQASDWQAAFAHYAEAVSHWPREAGYWERRETARFRLVQQHVDQAERAALAGRMDEARSQLLAALALDPGYAVARERLQQFTPKRLTAEAPAPASESAAPELKPQPGVRDFNYRGNTQGAFEDLAGQFGLKASFDPELASRQLRFRVAGVDFETAIRLLAQQTGTFWRALDERSFFVAENSLRKRQEYAPVVARTVLLPASATPERMTETLRIVREITGITRTQLDTRSRTLTLRDTPEAIALAVALIEQLEQARGELILEVEILEVDRMAARRLGITPPSSGRAITISPQDIREAQRSPAALLQVLLRLFGSPAALAGQAALVPPLVAFGGGRSIFLATLPGAAADFAEAFSVVRRARRMLLRAQDGEEATFFVGDRFPVSLAALTASLVSPRQIPATSGGATIRTDFPTGDGPVSVATGDFNGDARLDVAVANEAADTVSTLLGNGDGTLAAKTDFATGQRPAAVIAADFDTDGDPDLAVANQNSDSVSVLLGNGDGTFASATNFPVGAAPVAITSGNFDADANLDLAVANQGANTVSILLGNGDGTFDPPTSFAVGAAPGAVIPANLNSDGRLDLVVANSGSNTVSVLLGNGDGTFASSTEFATGTTPRSVVSADINGDTVADLAAANEGADSVSILLGNGDGTFDPATSFSTGAAPRAVTTGEFNADARLDLAVANSGAATVTVLFGNGDGTFGLRADFATGNGPVSLAAGEFNGDGRFDLAVANRDADSVSVIINNAAVLVPSLAGPIGISPYPAFQYEDLGLKVRATPRLHPENEVTLKLQFELRNLTAQDFNGIPVISNRTVEQTVRLRENEMTVLAGIVQETETRATTGWPLASRAPVAGHLAGRRDTQQREAELVIAITPRRVRLAPRVDRSLYVGREPATTSGPQPVQAQPPPQM